MSNFLHQDDDAKAITIPQVFSKNTQAENGKTGTDKKYCHKREMYHSALKQVIIYSWDDTLNSN